MHGGLVKLYEGNSKLYRAMRLAGSPQSVKSRNYRMIASISDRLSLVEAFLMPRHIWDPS